MYTTNAPVRRGGPTPLAKLVIGALLLTAAGASIRQFAPRWLGGTRAASPATVPPVIGLPSTSAQATTAPSRVATAPVAVAPPTSDRPGCIDAPEVRMLLWAWNAQQGLLYATGGPRAVDGSLMCAHDVNLTLTRQDSVEQMQAALVQCATELGAGRADCAHGAHYVAIMGDGAAAFFAAVNPLLARVCPDCTAEIIGSSGYSRGEDKFMGPAAWRQRPSAAAGGVVAGYLRDGDWNIAMKWAGDNGVCNNPDETTYDRGCLNWVAASDYLDAASKYVTGYCDERPVVSAGRRTGETARVCVDATVTWTPGDVNVAHGRGGVVTIASTRDYVYQMPQVVIGLHRWNQQHRAQVVGLLAAMTDGGQAVKQSAVARARAAELSAQIYGEADAAYWARYFDVVTERDATGATVELGGSAVSNLADNLHLFGVTAGVTPGAARDGAGPSHLADSIYAATYQVFGALVVHYYPSLVPRVPPVASVVDTSYLAELAARTPTVGAAELPTYVAIDPAAPVAPAVGHRSWQLTFAAGSARFTPAASAVLDELYRQAVVTDAVLEIIGHTDDRGDAEANRELARRRALAVKSYLVERAPLDFTTDRISVVGRGEDAPLVANDSAAHRALNRRVEVVMRAH